MVEMKLASNVSSEALKPPLPKGPPGHTSVLILESAPLCLPLSNGIFFLIAYWSRYLRWYLFQRGIPCNIFLLF